MESLIPKRKKTKKIWVGDVAVGGDAPISVQSMTNTETTDVEATVKQINDLEEAGHGTATGRLLAEKEMLKEVLDWLAITPEEG